MNAFLRPFVCKDANQQVRIKREIPLFLARNGTRHNLAMEFPQRNTYTTFNVGSTFSAILARDKNFRIFTYCILYVYITVHIVLSDSRLQQDVVALVTE